MGYGPMGLWAYGLWAYGLWPNGPMGNGPMGHWGRLWAMGYGLPMGLYDYMGYGPMGYGPMPMGYGRRCNQEIRYESKTNHILVRSPGCMTWH